VRRRGKQEMPKLNLQEKRRIENLVFGEIEESIRKFKNKRSNEYDELKESLIKNPPAPVKQLQEEIVKLENEIEAKKTELEKEGYKLGYENALTIREYGDYVNKELVAFKEETDKRQKTLEDLRKEFVVKIYADSEEVKDIFAVVSERIHKVVL